MVGFQRLRRQGNPRCDDSTTTTPTMNSVPVFRFSQLSVSVSKTTVRHGSVLPRRRTPKPELSNFKPGHGEQIWVWHHVNTEQVVYSHTKNLDVRQTASESVATFNG